MLHQSAPLPTRAYGTARMWILVAAGRVEPATFGRVWTTPPPDLIEALAAFIASGQHSRALTLAQTVAADVETRPAP